MNSRLENLNLHDVLFILKKHLRLIAVITVACTILIYIVSKFMIAPKYQAETKLIVNTASTSANTVDAYNAVQLSQKEVDTYAIIIENDTVLNKVIADLHLNLTNDQLSKKLDVAGIGTTEVIDLKVKDENPATAKAIAEDIVKFAPAEIIRVVKAGSVEVISPPETTEKPVSPNVPLYTAAAFIGGLLLSVIVAFLLEMLNNTFTGNDDVQKYLGFTVIGVIPSIGSKSGGAR